MKKWINLTAYCISLQKSAAHPLGRARGFLVHPKPNFVRELGQFCTTSESKISRGKNPDSPESRYVVDHLEDQLVSEQPNLFFVGLILSETLDCPEDMLLSIVYMFGLLGPAVTFE